MGELEPPQQEELGDIPIAKLVADAAEQRLEDDVCRNFNKVKWRVRTFIKRTPTLLAPMHVVTQIGFSLKGRNTSRVAVGAIHERSAG